MRVLFWTPVFWPKIGGVEVHAAKLLPALRERGHEFLVLTTKTSSDQPDADEYQGIPIYRWSFWNYTHYTQIDAVAEIRQQIAALKRAFSPELVHINAVDVGNFFHLLTAHVAPAPLLVTLHGEWLPRHNAIVKKILECADWVAGCSQAILDKGRELAPSILPRSNVIYNGLEVPPLLPAALPFEPPRLLCLGRLSPEKGFDVALSAFSELLNEFPGARLLIAGDGAARNELEQQAADLDIRDRVDFLGWVGPAEIPALINTATIVLMPSRQESLPLVALETALMARPIVGTRVGGLPEVVADGQTGLLVESENATALAAAAGRLLRERVLASDLGQAARTRVQQLFSWKNHVDSYDCLYKKLTTRALSSKTAQTNQQP
jgi:glycosyltransferase involved in cell wall biosynthesis